MGPGDAAMLIHSDRVHILIDLNGYSSGSKTEIFALKPAPLQMSALGYPGTLGADYMQYKLVDPTSVPPNSTTRERFTESMLYMPHTFVVTDHREMADHIRDKQACPTRAVFGIPDDKFVFACFNQLFKLDPEIFACWMRVMKKVPGSVLWLLRFPGLGEPNIRAEAKAHGIDPTRIYFSDVLPRAEHLSRIYLADIIFDTPTYNGCSTAADALWGATPMITMCVDRMCSRMGASVLKAAGCNALVTSTLEKYEELAVTLAKDSQKLWDIREKLEIARDTSPLFNTKKWVRDFEQCLEMAWTRYEQGMPPDDIGVEAAEEFVLDLFGDKKEEEKEEAGGKSKARLLTVKDE